MHSVGATEAAGLIANLAQVEAASVLNMAHAIRAAFDAGAMADLVERAGGPTKTVIALRVQAGGKS